MWEMDRLRARSVEDGQVTSPTGLEVLLLTRAETEARPEEDLERSEEHEDEAAKTRHESGEQVMCSGSEAGSYLRLIDFCITQL